MSKIEIIPDKFVLSVMFFLLSCIVVNCDTDNPVNDDIYTNDNT